MAILKKNHFTSYNLSLFFKRSDLIEAPLRINLQTILTHKYHAKKRLFLPR